MSDDPALTARLTKPRRTATRVVLDTRLRTPLSAKLVRTARKTPTLIVTVSTSRGMDRKRRSLERAGCEVVTVRSNRDGIDLTKLMDELHSRQMTNILVEGGGKVLGSFAERGLADEARVFVANKLIGGEQAPGPLRHRGPALMQDVIGVEVTNVLACGPDLCYIVKFSRTD